MELCRRCNTGKWKLARQFAPGNVEPDSAGRYPTGETVLSLWGNAGDFTRREVNAGFAWKGDNQN